MSHGEPEACHGEGRSIQGKDLRRRKASFFCSSLFAVESRIIKQDGAWWIGWVEEIPGVNCQGKTRAELQKNLRSAIKEALEFNRDDALAAAQGG